MDTLNLVAEPVVAAPEPPVLSSGAGSLLRASDGTQWVDLVSGFGAVFLGHGHPLVLDRLHAQLGRLWTCGRHDSVGKAGTEEALARVLPAGMVCGGFSSTGMESAEFALRIAATHTGRHEFIAFSRSMHGKSAVTAALCWDNAPVRPGCTFTLPFVDDAGEDEILDRLERRLRAGSTAALLVEPIQGSNGAHQASLSFYDEAMALCAAHGTLVIMDEIVTGLFRTGPAFFCSRLARLPDLLLFAKNMGNGFPVSCVALGPGVRVTPAALPGSTFSGNPLALAAVDGTLVAMATLPLAQYVEGIAAIARRELAGLQADGIVLRGSGALWCVEFDTPAQAEWAQVELRRARVLVTQAGRRLRLLPSATIPPELWSQTCAQVAQACLSAPRRNPR